MKAVILQQMQVDTLSGDNATETLTPCLGLGDTHLGGPSPRPGTTPSAVPDSLSVDRVKGRASRLSQITCHCSQSAPCASLQFADSQMSVTAINYAVIRQ